MNKRTQANTNSVLRNEKGMVLAVTLMLSAVLALLGTTAVMTTTTDLKIAGNYRESARALYNAEAGVHAVIAQIASGGFAWPAFGGSQTVTVTAPSGYSFDNGSGSAGISVTNTDGNYYRFQVTGYGDNNARKTIEAYFMREPSLKGYGVFAEGDVKIENNRKIYSYNSNVTPNPNPLDYPGASTGRGNVGSNKKVQADSGSYISGNVGLGASSGGTVAVYDPGGWPTPTVTGTIRTVGRVAPDPLGAVGGTLAGQFTAYSASNDNAAYMTCSAGACTASPGKIDAGSGKTVTLTGKAGGSNFYFSSVTLDGGATLTIDTTNGPVNIYMTDKLDLKDWSLINMGGPPTSLTIYSRSDKDMNIKNNGDFKGTVYAPYGQVKIENFGNTFGLAWGKEVTVKNAWQFYYDEALTNKFPKPDGSLTITSWKDVM
ncbi:MAG: pilus assembly PilX N-terminal domain-containing protein [Thermodesulfobacteriota bacterium]